MTRSLHTLGLLGLLLLAPPALAQGTITEAEPAGIAWYGTWKQGAAAARRLKRPILLVAAAPHCKSVSGLW